MKGIHIFCASQAATAICLSMDEASSSSSSAIHLGSSSPAIDRYNPIIRDSRRITKPVLPPSSPSSQPPINPKPHKNRKTSSKPNDYQTKKKNSSRLNDQKQKNIIISEPSDNSSSIIRKSWSCTKPGDFISPPGSSRYLLSDNNGFLDVLSNFDPVLELVPVESSKSQAVKKDESSSTKPAHSSPSPDQVVELRVSLHCKGCERKMRKHLSRMEGVTSFKIDFAAKKLTVIGDVTPLEVLARVSKVKNAQLWAPTISSSLSSLGSINHSEKSRIPKE